MIGDTLRVLRMQKGMTQEQLAAAVGVSPDSINFYEENKWRPGTVMVARLAETLNVPIEDIVGHDCKVITNVDGDTQYIKKIQGRYIVMATCKKH